MKQITKSMPKKKIQNEAWKLDAKYLAPLAAIASAKKAAIADLKSAGLEVDQALLDRLISLDLIRLKGEGNAAHYRAAEQGRSLLWHQKWNYAGYPMFAHHPVVRWALYLDTVFGEISLYRLTLDLRMSEAEIEPYLAKMANHNMIVRRGKDATLLDRSLWKKDY